MAEDDPEDPEYQLNFTYQRKADTPRTKRTVKGLVLRGFNKHGPVKASELALLPKGLSRRLLKLIAP